MQRQTKQPIHKCMAEHRRNDSAAHLHLKNKGQCFEDNNIHFEDKCFEQGVKEAKLEKLSLNRGGQSPGSFTLNHSLRLEPLINNRSLGDHSLEKGQDITILTTLSCKFQTGNTHRCFYINNSSPPVF